MKKKVFCFLMLVIFLLTGVNSWAQDADFKTFPTCIHCGMSREAFSHSRMLTTYDDGATVATCSLHCAALDFALNLDKSPTMIQVGDYDTKELINAETAVWVIGGTKPGVMTKNAKWAFAKKENAENVQKINGGKVATFDEALEAAYKDLNDDTKMIREKRKMKKMKMMHSH